MLRGEEKSLPVRVRMAVLTFFSQCASLNDKALHPAKRWVSIITLRLKLVFILYPVLDVKICIPYLVSTVFGLVWRIAKSDSQFRHICLPHETTRFPLDKFSPNFISEDFSKICQEYSRFTKIWEKKRVHYTKLCANSQSYLAAFFLVWEIYQKKILEQIKIHILQSIFFFFSKIVQLRLCEKIRYSQTGDRCPLRFGN
jgi:hypothetical protein